MDQIIGIAASVGVVLGLTLHFARQKRIADRYEKTIRTELLANGSLSLPELVVRLGLKDGFLNRGKVMNVLQPLVARGELVQEEPPGTTMRTRLSVLRFKIPTSA